jgi:enoyl-CoA hydratase
MRGFEEGRVVDRYGFSTIATELTEDGILRVTYNRPDRMNAINDLMHRELRHLYRRIASDDEVEVVVITGAGRGFCVGGDFQQMEENNKHGYPDGYPALFGDAAAMARNILAVPQPIIAAVNGAALGLGATLALFCDIVRMSSTAKIGDPHVQAGLVAADGGVVLWPMLLGVNRAKEYLMQGDLLDAATTERVGLINHVVEPDALHEAVMTAAHRLAAGASIAIRFNKRLVNKELEDRVNRIYDMALAMEAVTFASKDHLEAVNAFLAKRPPVFGQYKRQRV